jgi:HK97 family phage major capsid protein
MSLEYASLPLNPSPPHADPAVAALQQALEDFKQVNEEKLEALTQHNDSDILLTEKLERLEKKIASLSAQVARPPVSQAVDYAERENKSAILSYMRGGDYSQISSLETKFDSETGAEGGYLVPHYMEARLNEEIAQISHVRNLATLLEVSRGNSVKIIRDLGEFGAQWAGETAARPETSTPSFAEEQINIHDIYARPAASQQFLEDAGIDIEAWIIRKLAERFSEVEEAAFVNGDGVNKPLGFLKSKLRILGSAYSDALIIRTTGVAAALPAKPFDFLINLTMGLPARYRANAAWLMNASTLATLRQVKDNNGTYLWQPSSQVGQPSQLLGFPVYEHASMSDVKANSLPIAFGDFRAGYTIVLRRGLSILRDPYSSKPLVVFYATRRVGGKVTDYDAIHLVRVGV